MRAAARFISIVAAHNGDDETKDTSFDNTGNNIQTLQTIDGGVDVVSRIETQLINSNDKTTENTALLSDEITDHLNKTNPINNDDFIPPSQENESNISTESSDLLGRLYVAPVAFFNNTTSDYHAQLIVDSFKNAYNYEIVDSPNDADYLIKTSVLRAKVDALNNSTSRLQMVIAMELSFKDGTSSQTIHQNRFVVFENSENEQNVALKLLTKLFNNAVEQIEVYMQKHEKEKGNIPVLPSVITPSSLSDTNKDFSSFE